MAHTKTRTTHTPTQLIMLHCPPLPIHQLTAHQLTAHQSPPTTLHPPAHNPPAHSPPHPTHLWTCRSLLLSSAILNIRPTASSPWPLCSSSWVRGREGLGGEGRRGEGEGEAEEGRGGERKVLLPSSPSHTRNVSSHLHPVADTPLHVLWQKGARLAALQPHTTYSSAGGHFWQKQH